MDDLVLLKQLPPVLFDEVTRDLASYTVAFVRVDEIGDGHRKGQLLGSGILVSVNDTRAILTADHVLEVLPKTGPLGVFLEKTSEPRTLETEGLIFRSIAHGKGDAEGPDMGAVIIAPHVGTAIAARKSFVRLDSQRDRMLTDPPELRDGVWFAQGFLEERTVVIPDPDGSGTTTRFYNFSGVGGPDEALEVAGYDYFEFPVTHESRSEAPLSWGGMSGGGLWQVPLERQGEGFVYLRPLLSGVLFYQWPTTDTQCGVRAHGRKSIYDIAYRAISGREP